MKLFRWIAFLEGCSYLALGVTMYLKYVHTIFQPNYVVGMAHGFLFVVYCILAVYLCYLRKWKFNQLFWVILAAFIPFGTFIAEKKLYPKL